MTNLLDSVVFDDEQPQIKPNLLDSVVFDDELPTSGLATPESNINAQGQSSIGDAAIGLGEAVSDAWGGLKQAGSNFADSAKRKGLELVARGIVNHADTAQYLGDRARDLSLSALSGTVMVPEGAVGLMDIPTGGKVGKALEDVGFRPHEARAAIQDAKSQRSKDNLQKFSDTEGLWGKTKVVLENPSLAIDTTVESLPAMGAGGVYARGLGALAKMGGFGKLASNKVLLGAAGEGLTSAGMQASQIRNETDDRELTFTQSGLALSTGFTTALFGFAGGKLSDKLGIGDINTLAAGGEQAAANALRDNAITTKAKNAVLGAISEGFLQELPQELLEQIQQNIALDKPWTEGLDDAAVLAVMSGGIMGMASANANSGIQLSTDDLPLATPEQMQQMGLQPEDASGEVPQQAMDSPSIDEQLMAAVDRFHGDRNDSAAIYDTGDPPSAIEIDNTGLPFASELEQGQDASIPQQTDRPLDAPVEGMQTPKQMRNIDIARNKWDSMTKDERIDTAINELGLNQSEAERLAGRNFEYLGITEARSLVTNKNWLEGRSDADLAQPEQAQPEQTQTQPEAEESFKQDAVGGDTQPGAVDSSVEVDLFGNPIEQNAVEGLPVQEVPLGKLTLSKEVPQFKEGADDSGVVEPLGGKFDRRGVAPIQVWERLDGSLEIISGRHRFDLAKRSGEQTIPAQIHREADGFDAVAAATLDAELNIRDEQGGIADYANYFRNSQITEEEADARGLLARQKGKAGFIIGNLASDDTFASHSAGIITDEAARRIAEAAPNNDGLQAVGLKSLQEGSSIADAVNTIHAVSTFAPQGNVQQGDIFGMDTSGIEQAKKMARIATSKQRDIQANILAAKNAAKSPALAKKMGVDVKNPESVLSKIRELEAEKQAWDKWSTNPDLVAQIRAEMQPEEGLPTPKKQGVEKPAESAEKPSAETEAQTKGLDTPPKQKDSDTRPVGKDDGFSLSQQTEEELSRQDEERKAAEEKLAKEQAAEAKAEREAAEKAAAKQQMEAANEEFTLGQDANENLSGQRNMMDLLDDAASEVNVDPTEAQKEAGNYKKGHVSIQGVDIAIENPKGSERSGVDSKGKRWSVIMKNHYGYIKKTEGADGDQVDVFIGENPESDSVFIVDQINQGDGTFDEHKVMLGFTNKIQAINAYKSNYSSGWNAGKTTKMSMDEFKAWLKDGDTTQPVADAVSESQKTKSKGQAESVKNDKQDDAQTIDDFGEKLEGARKDLPRNFSDDLSDGDVKSQPLSKLWPSDLHTKIDNPVTAAIMFVLRQSIPSKPRVGYKLNRWVQAVQSARIAADELIDMNTLEQLEAKAKEKGFIGSREKIFTPAKLLSQLPKESWGRVSDISERPNSYRFGEDRETIPAPSSVIRIDGTLHRFEVGEFGAKEINEIKRLLNAQPETGLTTRDFDIYTRRADGTTYITRKIDKEKRSLKEFTKADGVKAAREYLRNNVAELEAAWEAVKERDNVGKGDMRNKDNRERLGKDWRKGKDITPEQFSDTFGFRGVQFGNWVSQGKGGKERQGMLNQAYDALMDLSSILNVPPKALSLNGTLGLAFGARGKGRAMAHYERDTVVINLTKTKGAGSLAHEWFHALDNYFAGLRGIDQSAKESFVTYQPEAYYVHKRGNAKIAKKDFEKAMKGEKFNGGYVIRGERNPSDWTLIDGIRPEVETAFANLVEALNKAPMHERAKVLDQGSSKKYWSSIIERAARSFEDYTIMKLDEEGITNDYLANVVSFKEFKRAKERYPYNKPEEMQPIKEAFDVLFNTIESREDAYGNVALYSRKAPPKEFAPKVGEADKFRGELRSLMKSLKSSTAPINVTSMPKVLQALGVDGAAITISRDVVRKATNGIKHNVPMQAIEQLPEELHDPLAVFQSSTEDNALVVLTELEDESGRPIIVALDLRKSGRKYDVIRISSAYGKDNIKGWVRNNRLVYQSKRATGSHLPKQALVHESSALKGLQLPNSISDTSGSNRILTEDDILSSGNDEVLLSRGEQGSLQANEVQQVMSDVLGDKLAQSIEVVQSQDQVPDGLTPIENDGVIEGVFDPNNRKIYLIADNLPTSERAAWVAFHELFHRGIRTTKAFRDYHSVVSRAGNNKMVERVANAIMQEDSNLSFMEAVEEALAELNAAEETGDYSQIESRYGVKVLNGLKHGIRKHIETFVNAVRRFLYSLKGKTYVSDAEVWQVIQGAREGYAEFDANGNRINYGLFSRQQQGNLSGLGEAPEETKFRLSQRMLQDAFNRFEVIQDWLKESGVNLQETSRVYEAETRMSGRIAAQLEDFREKTFAPLIEKVAKAGKTMEQLEDLLHAQHAQERNAHIATINKAFPDGGSGMTNADAKAILAQYANDTALQDLANEFREISKRRLELLVKEGVYSQQDADNMQNTYQFYVPLKGGPDTEYFTGTGKGLTGRKDIKRALGHSEREGGESIVENLAVDFERAIMLTEKNRMAKHLLSLALDANNPDLISLGRPEKRGVLVNKSAYGVWFNGQMVGSFSNMADAKNFIAVNQSIIGNGVVIQKTTDQSVVYAARPQLATNETVVFINGQQIRIQLNDELLARAWNNLGQNGVIGILKMSAGLNRWLSSVYTGYSPDFFVRNIIRDFSTGFSNVTGEEGFTTAVRAVMNYPSAVKQLMKYYATGQATPMIQSYRDAGGKTGGTWMSDLERVGDDVSKSYNDAIKLLEVYKRSGKRAATASALRRVFSPLFNYVEKFNAVSENSYRVAIYQTMVQQGRTVEDAAYRAKNVTVNFSKKGEWGTSLNAYSLFYNASIQGAANYGHAMIAGKHREQLWALTAGLASMAFMMAQAGYGGDDDDQDKLKDFELERSIPIKTSNGWITIPIPYEMGFFWSFGRHMSDLVDGKNSVQQTALKMAYSFASAYTVYGDVLKDGELDSKNLYTLLPTAIQIPAGPIVNRSTFGSPIYPESSFDPQQPDSQKMYRNTKGSIFELMTTTLNNLSGGDSVTEGAISVSPETLKYLNSALTGGAGRFIYDAMNIPAMLMQGVELGDLDSRDIPIARVVYKTETITEQRNKFRTRATKQEQALENFNRAKSVVKDQMRYIGESEEGLIEKYGFSQSQLIEQARLAEAIRKLAAEKRKAQAVVLGDKSRPLAARRADARKIEQEEQALYEVFFNNLK